MRGNGGTPAEAGRTRRRLGLVGAVVGFAATGVAVGVAAERALVRRARRGRSPVPDPHAGEPFGRLSYDESLTVRTPDGVDLHVEVVEPADGIALEDDLAGVAAGDGAPEPTVVFVHGFCLDLGSFHFQRKELTRHGGWRSVYYDQPGHGRSGRRPGGEYELSALGDALAAVLAETVPDGPVVLVGHSMGGMTVMAFAERHPEVFARRVAGVVLIATTAGRLTSGAGLPELVGRVGRPLLPLVGGASRLTGSVIDRARRASGDLAWLLTRRYGFGGPSPSPALVSYVESMNSQTSTETVARYLRTLHEHDRYPALAALAGCPVLLVCGDRDPITPLTHTEEMASHLPRAEVVVVPESGHLVQLEHADEVTKALLELLEKLG